MIYKIFTVVICGLLIISCEGKQIKVNKESESIKTLTFKSQLQEAPKSDNYEPNVWEDFYSAKAFKVEDIDSNNISQVHIISDVGTQKSINILFEKLPQLDNIEAIEIVGTNLTTNELEYLIDLLTAKRYFKKLSLNNVGLKILPANIGNLKELRTLDIPRNTIQTLPKEIGQLKKLTTLRVYNCRSFYTFPKELANLNQLINLDFAGTRIEH